MLQRAASRHSRQPRSSRPTRTRSTTTTKTATRTTKWAARVAAQNVKVSPLAERLERALFAHCCATGSCARRVRQVSQLEPDARRVSGNADDGKQHGRSPAQSSASSAQMPLHILGLSGITKQPVTQQAGCDFVQPPPPPPPAGARLSTQSRYAAQP